MEEDELNRHLASSALGISLAAILIALPFLISGGFDLLYPREADVNDRPLPSYETYATELYKDLSERDMFNLTGNDETKMRALYAVAERDHLTAVRTQALRRLSMFGVLLLAGLILLIGKFRFQLR